MFGVGLHLKQSDLISVKNIAIPGAIGQALIATLVGVALVYSICWPVASGIVVGLSIGVASTVVLVRLLTDNNLVKTTQGHIAIGWLVFEDLMIVIALLLLPVLASSLTAEQISLRDIIGPVAIAVSKFALLLVVMFTVGRKLVKYLLSKVLQTDSPELLTLTVLALTFAIATGSALVFGTSIALGALIAGMVIGQTDVRHQVAAHAVPMKDAFVVIFFLSVGMLFNPATIVQHFAVFVGILCIILIVKPAVAFIIIRLFKYPTHVAITVAIALAQIGEFSFILAEEAMQLKILPENAYDIIVASAFVSISLNPVFFKMFNKRLKV